MTQQHKKEFEKFPALICLLDETEQNDRKKAKRYVLSVINEYNKDLKQFIGAIHYKLINRGHMDTDLIVRIIRSIKLEYLRRVSDSIKLTQKEKFWLNNYIIARYRQEVNPYIGQINKRFTH